MPFATNKTTRTFSMNLLSDLFRFNKKSSKQRAFGSGSLETLEKIIVQWVRENTPVTLTSALTGRQQTSGVI